MEWLLTGDARARGASSQVPPSVGSAFLFDLDGTIASTSLAHGHAYKLAFAEIGHSISEYDFGALSGLHFTEVVQRLSGGLPADKAISLHKRKTQLFQEIAGEYVQPLPLLDLARAVRDLLPIALVTSATRKSVQRVLEVVDADELFEVAVVSEDVRKSKPDPEPYLLACSRLRVRPADCVAFEDSNTGCLSATRAGVKVVMVSDPSAGHS